MTTCKYIIKEGYPPKKNNNSFNSNDYQGLFLFILIIITLYLTTLGINNKFDNVNNNKILLLLLFFCTIFIYLRQIRIAYMFSFFITLFTKTPAFLDKKKYFPNYIIFEENFSLIKNEVLLLLKKTSNGKSIGFTKDTFDKKENALIGQDVDEKNNRGWRVFHIKLSKHYTKNIEKTFPNLCEILNNLPEVINCSLSILDEKTYIPIHNGYYKGMLRFMLPIIVPKDYKNVFICINYEKYHWKEGVGILWDDTFPHKVFNNTEETRIVLYMDIIRPLNGFLKNMNEILIKLLANSKMIKDEIKRTEIKHKL